MNQITHKERSSSLLRLESALGMDQNRPITVGNNSHNVSVHTHLRAKEPRKSFWLNSGRLQADRETSPCCQGSRQTGNGGEICEIIASTTHLERGLFVAEISFSATSARVGELWPALCLLQTLTDVEAWSSSYFFFPFVFQTPVGAFPLESHLWLLCHQSYLCTFLSDLTWLCLYIFLQLFSLSYTIFSSFWDEFDAAGSPERRGEERRWG